MAGMISKVQDPFLKQIVKHIEDGIGPAIRENYDAIIVSGMKLMWSEELHGHMQQYITEIQGPEDAPQKIAHGVVKLISLIQNESGMEGPMPAAVPAAVVLMTQALEYMEATRGIEITKPLVDQTTMLVYHGVFGLYGITPEVLAELQQQGQTKQPGQAKQQGAPPAQGPPPAQPAQPPQGGR